MRKPPVGLLGMIVLVVVVETFLNGVRIDYKESSNWQWARAGRLATRESKRFELLLFGDSQVNLGIVPTAVESVAGLKTLSLAMASGQATTTYFQLRRALQSGARPKAVVVDFNLLMLNHGKEENEPRWADYLSLGESFELATASNDPAFLLKNLVARSLLSYRERLDLRKWIQRSLNGEVNDRRAVTLAHFRQWRLNQGAYIFPRNPNWALPELEAWHKATFCNPDWIAKYHAVYMKKFFDLAAAHQIKVYWLTPPQPAAIERTLTAKGENDRLDHLITRVLNRYPNVTLVDARRSAYPDEAFRDHGHLDRVGANTLSRDLALIIKARPGARRVPLPDFQPAPEQAPIEDLHQSIGIVQRNLKFMKTL